MKKSILTLLVVVFTTQLFAQNKQHFIEVSGETAYEKVIEKYMIDVTVSEALVYDSYNNDTPDFEEIKDRYFDKLTAAGINTNELKEDKLGYLSGSYRKKGMLYHYETTNKDVFLSFLEIRAKGTQIQSKKVRFKDLTDAKKQELMNAAIKTCKTKAQLIAKSIKRELGAIIEVRDSNYGVSKKEITYYNNYNDSSIYYINLKYAIK